MKKLIKTLFGEIDLGKLNHPKLLKVIRERCNSPSFLFNYGDSDYSDGKKHSDYFYPKLHIDYRADYGEYTDENSYRDKHMDYMAYSQVYTAFAHYKRKN